MRNKFDDLLDRVQWRGGMVTDEELSEVATELGKSDPHSDPITLLEILGHAGNTSYRDLLEGYLEGPDGTLAGVALWHLCVRWGLTGDYVDKLLLFMRGVPWDERAECRMAALRIAGRQLAIDPQPGLLQALLQTYEDSSELDEIRLSAYLGLYEASGRNVFTLPNVYRIDLYGSIDPKIVRECKERLAKESAGAPAGNAPFTLSPSEFDYARGQLTMA